MEALSDMMGLNDVLGYDEVTTPRDWGPPVWYTMQLSAMGLPPVPSDAERQAWINLMEAMPLLLVCATCRADFGKEVAAFPPRDAAGTSEEMREWTLQRMNSVRTRLGKPKLTHDGLRDYMIGIQRRLRPRMPRPVALVILVIVAMAAFAAGRMHTR